METAYTKKPRVSEALMIKVVPSYGNESNQNDSLTANWESINSSLQEIDIHQYEALFDELERWNECLEKSPESGLMPPCPDKEP